jgi:hypothetical protein
LANHRLSLSRTSLDDNEYISRFTRLDGAIKDLSFSIRKSWISIPPFLIPYVNTHAASTGAKEMTAVGRAYMSHFLATNVFGTCFHPGIEPSMSRNLKLVEKNIRSASTASSKEEEETITNTIIQWRLTTLSGLAPLLSSPQSAEFKAKFVHDATQALTRDLLGYLRAGEAAGVESSVSMIVELAVGIAANLPLESRDVAVSYPMPLDPIKPTMKIETGLPALDSQSRRPSDSKDPELDDDHRRAPPASALKKPAFDQAAPAKSDSDTRERVRFTGGLAVEVRGRSILVKAPVWTF